MVREKEKESDIPRMIVARPRAVPIPRPRIAFGPTRLNLRRSFQYTCTCAAHASAMRRATHMGAFWSMSGTMKKRTMLPRM
jgi:hypothetical protein